MARLTYVVTLLAAHAAAAGAASPYGQLIGAYYSGEGADTVGSSGLNTLYMAFFDPAAMATHVCNFTSELVSASASDAPCVAPATGSGQQGLPWIMNAIDLTLAQLGNNTIASSAPTIFISFGGANQGGAAWDAIFASNATAALFGVNAASLAATIAGALSSPVHVGIDLDIESTSTTLPSFAAFISSFRAAASPSVVPLQMCVLSGMAQPGNDDHFKLAILQAHGPSTGGVTHINFMVNNALASCADMAVFWLDAALQFIPMDARVWGLWGEIQPTLILSNPGCTDGATPLFPVWAAQRVGAAVWEWWVGGTQDIDPVLRAIRNNGSSVVSG